MAAGCFTCTRRQSLDRRVSEKPTFPAATPLALSSSSLHYRQLDRYATRAPSPSAKKYSKSRLSGPTPNDRHVREPPKAAQEELAEGKDPPLGPLLNRVGIGYPGNLRHCPDEDVHRGSAEHDNIQQPTAAPTTASAISHVVTHRWVATQQVTPPPGFYPQGFIDPLPPMSGIHSTGGERPH